MALPRHSRVLSSPRQTMLPNFLIIGAAKAGTTSLQRYLATHPYWTG